MNKRSAKQSKLQILEAARKVFAEHGYAQASMRQIAQAAGVSVGGLYLYFSDKEALYLTLMQESLAELNQTTREALQAISDPREAMRCYITISIEHAKSRREMLLMQGRELGLSFGLEIKQEFFRERRKVIEGIILQGIDAGVFAACDVKESARIIFNTLRGNIVSIIIDEEGQFSAEGCYNLLLNGLLRR